MDNKSAYHTQKNRDLILTNNFHKFFSPCLVHIEQIITTKWFKDNIAAVHMNAHS